MILFWCFIQVLKDSPRYTDEILFSNKIVYSNFLGNKDEKFQEKKNIKMIFCKNWKEWPILELEFILVTSCYHQAM